MGKHGNLPPLEGGDGGSNPPTLTNSTWSKKLETSSKQVQSEFKMQEKQYREYSRLINKHFDLAKQYGYDNSRPSWENAAQRRFHHEKAKSLIKERNLKLGKTDQ